MDIFKLIEIAKSRNASDIHLSADSPPLLRIDGALTQIKNFAPMTADEVRLAFLELTTVNGFEKFQKTLELDFKYILPDRTLLRCNVAQERGTLSLSIRILPAAIPTIDCSRIPTL